MKKISMAMDGDCTNPAAVAPRTLYHVILQYPPSTYAVILVCCNSKDICFGSRSFFILHNHQTAQATASLRRVESRSHSVYCGLCCFCVVE